MCEQIEAAGGGVAIVAPGRAGEAKSPQGVFAAREGLEKNRHPTNGRRRRPLIAGRHMPDIFDAHLQ